MPVRVGSATDWAVIYAGSNHTLAIKVDGSLWAWGENTYGQLGDGSTIDKLSPVPVGSDTDWTAISAGEMYSLALKSTGTLWAWGSNAGGWLAQDWFAVTTSNVPLQIGSDNDWDRIAAGDVGSFAVKRNGTLWGWATSLVHEAPPGQPNEAPGQIGTSTMWRDVAARGQGAVALMTDGTLMAWGEHYEERIDSDNYCADSELILKSLRPIQIDRDARWAAITHGGAHAVGLKSDETVWSWGQPQVHFGNRVVTTATQYNPKRIGSDSDWATVSAGDEYSLGVKQDGTVLAWGRNGYGQLGDGTFIDRYAPVVVGSDGSFVDAGSMMSAAWSVAGGSVIWGGFIKWCRYDSRLFYYPNGGGGGGTSGPKTISMATQEAIFFTVSDDGVLAASGPNEGQLGNGEIDPTGYPWGGQIGTDTDWRQVTTSGEHTVAIKSNGTLWAWGANGSGQLGDGTTTHRLSPVKIGTGTQWIKIATGRARTYAIKANGTLWTWGQGVVSPTRVGSDTNWAEVSTDGSSTLALKTDGSL